MRPGFTFFETFLPSFFPCVGLMTLLGTADAFGHGGNPAVAWLDDPAGIGNVVDEEFTFRWVDFDMSIPTGTATVDFYYTSRRPPAYLNGDIHPQLEGTSIVQGILEKDPDNQYTWDTSRVPAGSYYLWSIVIEPPEEVMSPQIVSFSPGILTVAHPGDPLHPALLLTTPTSSFQFADKEHEIQWVSFDPDQSGRVRLEVGTSSLGEDFETIAEDLDARQGSFLWITEDLAEDEWQVRATITDARGLSFTTYARYVLQITHVPSEADAGTPRPSPVDAGTADTGTAATPTEGCRCLGRAQKTSWKGLFALGLLGALSTRTTRRR